jgi:cytochrome b involved in lipid metabolism
VIPKLTFAALVAFWASVATILALSALTPQSIAEEADTALPEIDAAELAEHSSLEDCWMAIEGKVYDFSDYVPQHPTPPFVLEPWCGREATEGMRTKGYGRDHSAAAWASMEPYQVGVYADRR